MLGIKLTQNTEGGRAHAYVSQVMLLSYFLQGAHGIDLHILFLQTSVRWGRLARLVCPVFVPCFRHRHHYRFCVQNTMVVRMLSSLIKSLEPLCRLLCYAALDVRQGKKNRPYTLNAELERGTRRVVAVVLVHMHP